MDPQEILLTTFGSTLYDFLDAASEIWPELNDHREYVKGNTRELYDEFQKLSPFYDKFMNNDVSVLDELPEKYDDFKNKLKSVEKDVVDTCFQFIKNLIQSSTMTSLYDKCPKDLMSKVSSLAQSLAEDLSTGKLDMSTFNPLELTDKLLGIVDPDEVKEWSKNMENEGAFKNIAGMFTGENNIFSQLKSEGMPDLSAFLNPDMMQSMMSNMSMSSMIRPPRSKDF